MYSYTLSFFTDPDPPQHLYIFGTGYGVSQKIKGAWVADLTKALF